MPGVETRPELIYTEGVAKGRITLEKMVALLSENIAKQFSMYPQKGVVQEGSDADLVVWDPRTTGVIAAKTQLQNVDYTPYEGFETQGQARMVYLRGQKVAEAGQVILANQGKFVFVKQLKIEGGEVFLEKLNGQQMKCRRRRISTYL